MSSPHSTSFLDLNGDCMADIFMQKTRFNTDSKGKVTYQHYYEIYLARMMDGNLKYCLDRANSDMNFVTREAHNGDEAERIVPFIEFVDIDRDGMIDAYFVHEGKLYIYYNMLKRKEYSSGLGESFLCFKQEEVDTGAIFQDFDLISAKELESGGNEYTVV